MMQKIRNGGIHDITRTERTPQLSTDYNKSTKPYCLDAGHTLHFLQIIKTNLPLPRLSLKVEYPPPINVLSTIAKADVNGVNKSI